MNVFIVEFNKDMASVADGEFEIIGYKDANNELIDQIFMLFLNKFGYCSYGSTQKKVYYMGKAFLIDIDFDNRGRAIGRQHTHKLMCDALIKKMRDDKIDSVI